MLRGVPRDGHAVDGAGRRARRGVRGSGAAAPAQEPAQAPGVLRVRHDGRTGHAGALGRVVRGAGGRPPQPRADARLGARAARRGRGAARESHHGRARPRRGRERDRDVLVSRQAGARQRVHGLAAPRRAPRLPRQRRVLRVPLRRRGRRRARRGGPRPHGGAHRRELGVQGRRRAGRRRAGAPGAVSASVPRDGTPPPGESLQANAHADGGPRRPPRPLPVVAQPLLRQPPVQGPARQALRARGQPKLPLRALSVHPPRLRPRAAEARRLRQDPRGRRDGRDARRGPRLPLSAGRARTCARAGRRAPRRGVPAGREESLEPDLGLRRARRRPRPCGTQPTSRAHFRNSRLGDDAAVLAAPSGKRPAPPRRRADNLRDDSARRRPHI